MDCVVTAGGLPTPDDPLFPYTEGASKALLEMNGRTMLERVVDALQTAVSVDEVVVVGLGRDMGMTFLQPVHHLPDQGSMIGNVIAGINWVRQHRPEAGSDQMVLVSSADIPTISGDIVDKFVAGCEPFDRSIYYNFVDEPTMERRFPGSNRTFVKLRDVSIAGGDLLLARADLADSNRELWEALTNARKHAWQLARIVGLPFLIKFLLRRVSLQDVEDTAARVIGRPVRTVLSPYAELAMDADKPHQVDLLRAALITQ